MFSWFSPCVPQIFSAVCFLSFPGTCHAGVPRLSLPSSPEATWLLHCLSFQAASGRSPCDRSKSKLRFSKPQLPFSCGQARVLLSLSTHEFLPRDPDATFPAPTQEWASVLVPLVPALHTAGTQYMLFRSMNDQMHGLLFLHLARNLRPSLVFSLFFVP